MRVRAAGAAPSNTQLTAWSQELSFTVCEVGTVKINLKLQKKKTTNALDELGRSLFCAMFYCK